MSDRGRPQQRDAVVATGFGLATGLGLDVDSTFARVLRGETAFGPLTALEQPLPPEKGGGQAVDLPADFEPSLPREVRYLRWTIAAALRDAGVDARVPADRRAVVLGTTLHGMRAGGEFLRTDRVEPLRTFLAGDTLDLAVRPFDIGGPALTTCSACSSSLGAIALAVTLLERGEADLVVAGGYDTISEYAWAGFNALRLVSDPPVRPFARDRVGMKLAEGYGIVVLERADDAAGRGARGRVTVAGWGESADAHHLTRPHPEGSGASAAMRDAIARAGLTPAGIGLVAAHATGTPDNDQSEAAALIATFGGATPPVVGFKSHLGHTLGGAGAVELILSARALETGALPPTANVAAADVEYPHVRLADASRSAPIAATLNTSLGFGGANTCVVLRPASEARGTLRGEGDEAVITGVGVVLPNVVGDAEFSRWLDGERASVGQAIADEAIESRLNARRVRRMSPYVKISLAAASIAVEESGLIADQLAGAGAILGTTHGSAGFSFDYYGQVVREGLFAANPALFAEGVPNAAAAQLSLMLGLRGGCQTIIGTRTAGLDALRLAALRIANGDVERLIVCAAEESHPVLDRAYRADARPRGRSISAGVALILESKRSAERRGAAVLGSLGAGSARRTLRPGTRFAALRAAAGARHQLPRLDGDAFSVAPLLAVAASLRAGRDADVAARDRTGLVSTAHVTAARPVAARVPEPTCA